MYDNGGVQRIAEEIARLLDASVTLEDRAFQLLAYGAQSDDIDAVRQESILRRRASPEVRAHFESYGIATATGPVRIPGIHGMRGRICVPLRHGGVTYGYLWLLDSGTITDERLAAIAPLVDRAAAMLAMEARGRHVPLADLFSADPARRAAAGEAIGTRVDGPVCALAVRTGAAGAGSLFVGALRTLPRGVLIDPSLDEPVLPVLAPAAHAPQAARILRDQHGTAAGIGGPRDDVEEAWESWREALLALRVAEHVERHAPIADWPELGIFRFLARLPRRDLAALAAESAALRSAGPELARTVEAYLDHAGHVQETAAALGVHRQTLYYRLGRAEELTGLDLARGEDRLLLHLSLKAAALTGPPRPGEPGGRGQAQ
ncbi:MAG: helix-turn-helix domain-containing protein [Thermobispora bispora]|uniref:Transcriptional regulator, CdaR n=1 Tax=Thermobispora bispora (strain ATCC 19993 / DSM 43833 / CBS 139.67 / JCM 10125 / KCTC 9307 / NBRC 14880 / R51) TaxID=469371 RepID=D6YA86_THEBD|nr:transcriptional regulator, CdaR [Thermobispora bispora DSM 43833]MBO2474122.1 PucR family transcriptional regulator [Actinomycetales bacterium]MBX6168357.1 helix-turn-helix domain-containing protein [Thermobispora bispora]QSI48054.1 PucR family transcriptional regulator [Thermobispora bispora]